MKNAIRWMAGNHVAANLLMMIFIVGGIIKVFDIKQEVFPEISLDRVQVMVAYPGAGPEEVEEGIVLKIEDSLTSVDGIKEINSTANEGMGSVMAEISSGEDVDLILQDIKSEVDRIVTFPEEAEKPVITKILMKREVISVLVSGDVSERSLREQAELIREELLVHPQITQVALSGVRPLEISVEISEENLRQYNLTLDAVAAKLRAASLDLPGGNIKTRGGEILLRTKEKRYRADEFKKITVIADSDGTRVRLGDIATVTDTFEELDLKARFNGRPAASVDVFRVGDQTPTEISEIVKAYVTEKSAMLPDSIQLDTWNDRSELLESRLNLLTKNAFLGLILVIIVLGLFLEVRLAFWVMLGIPISFFGAFIFLPTLAVSVNMISLLGFILALGIVVDDAIIVGENVFSHRQKGKPFAQAAVDGATEVRIPVTFSILTTVAAFMPLCFIEGHMGNFIKNLPLVVIPLLLVSLIECLFVLPAHLSNGKARRSNGRMIGKINKIHHVVGIQLSRFVTGPYQTFLRVCVRNRYATMAVCIAVVLLSIGVFQAGIVKFVFMPEIEGDIVNVNLQMPPGTPVAETERIQNHILDKAMETVAEIDGERPGQISVLRHTYAVTGGGISGSGPGSDFGGIADSHIANIALMLTKSEDRNLPIAELTERWRDKVGDIPGAEAVTFRYRLIH
ncbi:MAG: efflux RND transporter permease subunit, partial [Deltaproteobacteria bacterium]|nr:efflux RND transporter permease subunit [Deltaproteobacteria bacterium]